MLVTVIEFDRLTASSEMEMAVVSVDMRRLLKWCDLWLRTVALKVYGKLVPFVKIHPVGGKIAVVVQDRCTITVTTLVSATNFVSKCVSTTFANAYQWKIPIERSLTQ